MKTKITHADFFFDKDWAVDCFGYKTEKRKFRLSKRDEKLNNQLLELVKNEYLELMRELEEGLDEI